MKGIFFLIFIPFLALSQSNDVLKIRGTKPIELLNSDELFFPGRYDGKLLEYSTFNIIFTSFCLLILINGSNFVDGLNGLLLTYLISVIFVLFKLKLNYYSPKYF